MSIAALDFGAALRVSVISDNGALRLADQLPETSVAITDASIEEIALLFAGVRSFALRETGMEVTGVVCCAPSDRHATFSGRAYLAGFAVGLKYVSIVCLPTVVRSAAAIGVGQRLAVIEARRSGVCAEIAEKEGVAKTVRSSLDDEFLMKCVIDLLEPSREADVVVAELAGEICDRWWSEEGDDWPGDCFRMTPSGWLAMSISTEQKHKLNVTASEKITCLIDEIVREPSTVCVVIGDGARRIEALLRTHGKQGVRVVTPPVAAIQDLLVEHGRRCAPRFGGTAAAAIDILVDRRSQLEGFDGMGRVESGWYKMRLESGTTLDLQTLATSLHQGGLRYEANVNGAKHEGILLGKAISRLTSRTFNLRLECCRFEDGSVGIKAASKGCIDIARIGPGGVEQATINLDSGE